MEERDEEGRSERREGRGGRDDGRVRERRQRKKIRWREEWRREERGERWMKERKQGDRTELTGTFAKEEKDGRQKDRRRSLSQSHRPHHTAQQGPQCEPGLKRQDSTCLSEASRHMNLAQTALCARRLLWRHSCRQGARCYRTGRLFVQNIDVFCTTQQQLSTRLLRIDFPGFLVRCVCVCACVCPCVHVCVCCPSPSRSHAGSLRLRSSPTCPSPHFPLPLTSL